MFVPLALGLYLAMDVLSLPDLTIEGTFGVGGAVTAALIVNHGVAPLVAVAVSIIAGALISSVTVFLHLWLHLSVLIAGIVVMTACFSVSLIVMGTGNLSLLGSPTVVSRLVQDGGFTNQGATIVVGSLAVLLFAGGLIWFLQTEYGLSIRASGQNIQTARGLGIRTERRQLVGLMVANALAASSGSLLVQTQSFMDVTVPVGVIVVGLASLIIGASLVRSERVSLVVLGVVVGMVIYQFIVSLALRVGLQPTYLKLVTAIIVITIIGVRLNGHLLKALPGSQAARRVKAEQLRFYEEDRVASFL